MRRVPVTPERKEEIVAALTQELEARPEIQLAYLHGSLAEGRDHVQDVDVAVLLSGAPDEDEALEAELEIEQSLDRATDLPVDVRVLNHAPLTFRFAVLRTGLVLLSRSKEARDNFECGTLSLYHDFSRHLEEYRREALGLGA